MAANWTQGKNGAGGKRGGGPRPLATSMGGVAKRTLGRRGFAEGGLIADWRAIVGPELAACCWPDRLSFPPGRKDGGTLRILAAGSFAIELQHMEPQVLERVNGHFGYRAIDRITILQAPPREATARPQASKACPYKPADPARKEELEAALSTVEDPEIRVALERLAGAMTNDDRNNEEQ